VRNVAGKSIAPGYAGTQAELVTTKTKVAKSGTPKAALKVLVAVHGIGDQTRFATLQQLVHRCLSCRGKPQGVPIGKLHSLLVKAGTDPEELEAWGEISPLPGDAFAEVYWADIGRANEEYVLEDSVRWAHTIVERLLVVDLKAGQPPGPSGPPAAPQIPRGIDAEAVRRTLTDIATAISIVRLANRALTHLKLGSVELDHALVRYLGDVQLFAEFASKRALILARFEDAMQRIEARAARRGQGREVEIHLCAHSQGSVVAFMGLLDAWKAGSPWLRRVRSFMTIGSPIDKFLILWPELWYAFCGLPAPAHGSLSIPWANYADRGDPVGYELDTARYFMRFVDPGLFDGGGPVDRIYSRYAIPGKAHIDYWEDDAPFREWLAKGVDGGGLAAAHPSPPADRTTIRILSTVILFALPAAMAWLAAHFIGTAIDGVLGADAIFTFGRVAATALLVLGSVAFGGASRVSRRPFWLVLGAGLFCGGATWALLVFPFWYVAPAVAVLLVAALAQNLFDRWGK